MTAERGDELGHLLVAADSPEFAFGFGHPGGAPSAAHVAFVSPAFDVAGGGASDRDHRFDHVGAHQGAGQGPVDTEATHGEHLLEALSQTAGRVGTGAVKFGRQPFGFQQAAVRVGVSERSPQPGVDLFTVGFGEMIADVSAFVDLATLDQRQLSEHSPHRGGQCFGAVDHHQQTTAVVEAAVHEIGQQGLDQDLVLGVAEPQPDRDLGAISGDNEGDNAGGAGEVDTVDHQHRRVQLGEITGKEVGECFLGATHEPARHRRFRCRGRLRPGLGADRISDTLIGSGRDPGQHPLHHRALENITVCEHAEGLQRHLARVGAITINAMNPRSLDRQALAAHHHRRRCRTAPHMAALGISRVPRPAQRVGLLGHDRPSGGQPGLHRQRHQPLTTQRRDLAQLDRQHVRQQLREPFIRFIDQPHSRSVYVLHGGPFLRCVFEDLLTMPQRHRPEGDHHPSTSTTPGTTSLIAPDDETEQRLQDSRIALRDADANLREATRAYETASVVAVASAETGVADTGADVDARNAAGDAVDAFAAVFDAARFAAFAETSSPLNTPTYDAAYESALDAAWGQSEPGRVTAEIRLEAVERALADARRALEEAPAIFEKAQEEARAVAAAVREEAEIRAAVLDSVATIAQAFGDDNDYGSDVAHQAARQAAYNEAEDTYSGWRSENVASWVAHGAARDAAFAAQAGLALRLDQMAEQTGLDADTGDAHEAAMSSWIEAWTLAEDPDWDRRVGGFVDEGDANQAAVAVFDRQPAYDDLAYRAATRAVRTAVAASVPPSESVEAAEAEDLYWAEGGAAHSAFVAARERIASVRAGYRGLLHPGTDLIAWSAYHVALDLLESSAQAEAADIRAIAAATMADDVEPVVEIAQESVHSAEAELADAHAALDAARPNYDLAVRAAWRAVAAETGCG